MGYRRWLTVGVALAVVAAAGALGGVRWAQSQAAFPDGAFVVGADETRWVVGSGVRYRMSFVTDDAGVLPSLRESPTVVATVAEARAALAGGDPAAAASAPVPVPAAPAAPRPAAANPAETLVGQRVTACNNDADLEVVVARAEWTKTVIGESTPGNGLWVVALIDVTNVSDKAEALTTRPLQLRDERGRVYEVQEYPPDPVELARAYGVHPAFEEFEPGIMERSVVTFLVPEDVGPLTLVGKRDFC